MIGWMLVGRRYEVDRGGVSCRECIRSTAIANHTGVW